MVNSDERKLSLSGWLQKNGQSEYCSSLRLQKFLFFYETISKLEKTTYDLKGLRGYKRGPVFSAVWGDYTKDSAEFCLRAEESYKNHPSSVIDDRADLCRFIVSAFSEMDLVNITHSMDIWARKKDLIDQGHRQVSLDENDLTPRDEDTLHSLMDAFPKPFVDKNVVKRYDNTCYVFSREDAKKLTEKHEDVLWDLAFSSGLENPVYAHIDKDGVILLD